jgi:hypothetical protein
MFSLVSKLFGSGSSIATPVGQTRQVNLSGNVFSFAMPEDFSRDMPAEDLVEQLDINNLELFNNPEYGNLIRRWWDIKHAGFFGQKLGTVMMDISVQRVPENSQKRIHSKPYNISNRLDLLLMIDEILHFRFDELIESTKNLGDKFSYYLMNFSTLIGFKLNSAYRDKILDQKKWIAYSVGAPENQMIVGYVLPVTNSVYLELVFTYSPDQNVLPRDFLNVAYQKTDIVENSARVEYLAGNAMKNIVGANWLKITNDEVLEQNRDMLLVPLFGPDIHKRLAGQKKLIEEATKAFNQLEQDERE